MLLRQSPSLREVRAQAQGRDLEARTEAEAIEEGCFLACLAACLGQLRTTTRSGLPPPINNQSRKRSTDVSTGQLDEGSFSIESLRVSRIVSD